MPVSRGPWSVVRSSSLVARRAGPPLVVLRV